MRRGFGRIDELCGRSQPQTFYSGQPFEHDPKDIGVVVLSGRPDQRGQWHVTFAPGHGSKDPDKNIGPVFLMVYEGTNACKFPSADVARIEYAPLSGSPATIRP